MKRTFRQSMAWLHGWAGILVGWILYAVFVSGTLSYFRLEITHWMRPELSEARVHPDAVARALRLLQDRAPDAPRWLIDVPEPRRPTLRVGWSASPARGTPDSLLRRFESVELDPVTGQELVGRNTRGGDFFRQFHSELSLAEWGRWIVGACAMTMLISILSGIITRGNIFRNLLKFRPGSGPRPWREVHNIVGVLALPYHVLITYTGLVTLMLMYMPAAVEAQYRFDSGAFLSEILPSPPASAAAGHRAELAPIEPMLREARRRWGGASPVSINIEHPNDAGARIDMKRGDAGRVSANLQTITFDGVSGKILSSTPDEPAALHTYGVLRGLHFAHFSPVVLRWLFAFCGVLGAGMVATGLMLWSVKRMPVASDSKLWSLTHRVLLVFNRGVIVGIWWGVAAYFLSNRLLPADFTLRSAWEVRCFFIVWALSFIVSLLTLKARWAWSMQFAVAALAFASLPIVSALTTRTHLGNSISQGLWIYAGFDLAMIGLSAMFATTSWLSATRERTSRAIISARIPADHAG